MLTKYLLPLLAIAGVCLTIYTVVSQNKKLPTAEPFAQPASAPYASDVPGAGLVEPSSEYISVGTHVAGVVSKVHVKAGDQVKAGDTLFEIDDRSLRAELALREANVGSAHAEIAKLKALPRTEDIPPAEARVEESKSQLADVDARLGMLQNLTDKRAVSNEELSTRQYAVQTAKTRLAEAQAQLTLLKAGAFEPDLKIAEANLASAIAQVSSITTELDRLIVRSPIDAEVLKVNIRAGEFAGSGGGMSGMGGSGSSQTDISTGLMVLGSTNTLHIRVDVDENDAWRVQPGAEGRAYVRGNSKLSTTIAFVRFEPYVLPKKSLTGSSGERVDTRVLQVIYAFQKKDLPVFVGQQMDVFLKAPPLGDAKFGVDAESAGKDLRSEKP